MKEELVITASPHIKDKMDVGSLMRGVIYGLIPAVAASLYFYRGKAVGIIVVSVLAALVTEVIFQKVRRRKVTLLDGSALLTGLLFALVLPPDLPLGIVVLGAVMAIALGKQIFGGLGYNIFNPALVGRAFLLATFPVALTTWTNPLSLDAVTGATPLGLWKFQGETTPLLDLFLGRTSGSLGEASALALLLGGVYLLWKKYIDWRIPLAYFVAVFVFGGGAYLINADRFPSPLFHILAGGFLLGALFMATDPVTTPLTKKGRWIFGFGSGILLIIIRLWGGLPEGVMYSILLMNMTVPLINKYTRPKPFGGRKKR